MNKLVRGVVTGSIIGAAVGLTMLWRNRKMGMMNTQDMSRQARGTMNMVKNNAMRWTSAVKNGTEALSRRLARRNNI